MWLFRITEGLAQFKQTKKLRDMKYQSSAYKLMSRFELPTSSLPRRYSTPELHQQMGIMWSETSSYSLAYFGECVKMFWHGLGYMRSTILETLRRTRPSAFSTALVF